MFDWLTPPQQQPLPPESAAAGALSPEDQRKRMLVQQLQKPQSLSANPGMAETAISALNSGMAGYMQGAPQPDIAPGTAANGGWTTQVQPTNFLQRLFGNS